MDSTRIECQSLTATTMYLDIRLNRKKTKNEQELANFPNIDF